MTITIQPKSPKEDPLKLPYPYHISEDGKVGRQEFWKGEPAKLIGFANKPKAGKVDLDLPAFWSVPVQAVGLYPVFEKENGEWYTLKTMISSVRVND